MATMKSKIIIALTVLITLAVTSANAQPRHRSENQRHGFSNDYGHGRISKNDRHRLAKERRHYRHDRFNGHRDGKFSYRERKHLRHDNRKGGRHNYSYRNKQRRFD